MFNIQFTKDFTNISYGNIIDLNETFNMLEGFLIIEEDEKSIYTKANTCFVYIKNMIKYTIDNCNYLSINRSTTDINQKLWNHCVYLIQD
jgi:hypothetical protein